MLVKLKSAFVNFSQVIQDETHNFSTDWKVGQDNVPCFAVFVPWKETLQDLSSPISPALWDTPTKYRAPLTCIYPPCAYMD